MNDNKRRRFYQWIRASQQRWRKLMTTSLVCVLVLALCVAVHTSHQSPSSISSVTLASQTCVHPAVFSTRPVATESCQALYSWPVRNPNVTNDFDGPEQPWLPGHRGVDLDAAEHTQLIAPADGTIAFVGKVAGKDVVTIKHNNGVTSTFEPATTTSAIGDKVSKEQPFAMVSGESDHCEETCVHWGLKQSDTYLDPNRYTEKRRIVLKKAETHQHSHVQGDYNA